MKRVIFLILISTAVEYGSALANVLEGKLNNYFPSGYVEKMLIITDGEKILIESSAKVKLQSQIFTLYSGINRDGVSVHGILANATIRTHPIVFFGYIDTTGAIHAIDIVAFLEPDDYRPTNSWLDLLIGRKSSEDLFPGSTIANITGATLTARTITRELRSMLEIIKIKIREQKK